MDRFYTINPGSKNGDMVIYINYNDKNVDIIPYEPFETINDRVKECANKYRLIKRKEKINKLLNGIKN